MWLVRDDEVLATAEVAPNARARRRGLLGRDEIDGVLVLRPCRHVHTFRMRFPIDVAFCDVNGDRAADMLVARPAECRRWCSAPRSSSRPARARSNAGDSSAGDRIELRG